MNMPENLKKHLPFILLLPVTFWWLRPAWYATLSNMHDHSQHMEYVWMIPVLALFLLWLRRDRILASLGRPAIGLAVPFLLGAAALLFLGLRGGQDRFLQASAVLFLMALPLLGYGRRTFAEVWFPVLLLAFVMPVGFLDNFTVPLRRASVTVTAVILNGLGVAVHQSGTAILSADPTSVFQLDVADPCSGIRSLVALFVGTAAYGALALRKIGTRWILFIASVPIAFLGNIIRLLLTALTCRLLGQAAGMQVHDNALFLVAPIYVLCVFACADLLRRWEERGRGKAAEKPSSAMPDAPTGWGRVATVGVLAGLLLAFRGWAVPDGGPTVLESDAFISKSFADLPGMSVRFPYFCQNRDCLWSESYERGTQPPSVCPECAGPVMPVAKAELDILPADTQSYKATYTRPDGIYFTVALVIAGQSRFSIHRPELCLPSQGYTLSSRVVRELYPGLPMAFFSLRRSGSVQTTGFCYVFLNSAGATVSNLRRVVGDTLVRSFSNRIPRWSMVTISSNIDFLTPEGERVLRAFLEAWAPTLRTDACD